MSEKATPIKWLTAKRKRFRLSAIRLTEVRLLGQLGRRALSLVMCFAILLSLTVQSTLAGMAAASTGEPYVREADDNTMDSYVQASLGGLIYTQEGVDGVSTATIRNNFGSRYAGEVWADKSVFARNQQVIAEIRPFEAGHVYDDGSTGKTVKSIYTRGTAGWTIDSSHKASELQRALDTLHYWLGDNVNYGAYGFSAENGESELSQALGQGTLTSVQADALNAAINKAIAKKYASGGYGFRGDGDFNGTALQLGKDTDGIDASITMSDDADFLHVYSVLGSTEKEVGVTPLDVVMVLDVSGSMGDPGSSDSKIRQSVDAMNQAITTLMELNINNRVGVVVFSSYAAELIPLSRPNPLGTRTLNGETFSEYIQISQYVYYQTNSASTRNGYYWRYTFKTEAGRTVTTGTGAITGTNGSLQSSGSGDGTPTVTDPSRIPYIGTNTNIDGGMWTGLSLLANADNTVVTVDNKQLSRIPSFIFLGDGDPQIMMTWTGGNWWAPNTNSITNEGMFDDIPIVLSTIMHTSFMKSAVINHYTEAAKAKQAENLDAATQEIDLNFYSVGIEMGQAGHGGYGPQAAQAIMDPKDTAGDGEAFGSTNTSYRNSTYVVREAYSLWETWGSPTGGNVTANSCVRGYAGRVFNQFGTNTIPYNVTKAQVIENTYYTDQYFSADAGEIGQTLEDLIQEITTPTWTPVSGSNSAGVDGALTYSDPIGDYMTVDSVTDMILFGTRYKIQKFAVYNYEANKAILEQTGKKPTDLITEGWYSETVDENGITHYKLEDAVNGPGANFWSKGWVYRVSYQHAQDKIPTLKKTNSNEDLSAKERNTTFTGYRVIQDLTHNATIDQNNANSSVSFNNSGQQTNWTSSKRVNLSYDFKETKDAVIFDLLDDIVIWTEDTGDYRDDALGTDFVVDDAYSQALFINVNTNALPVQVATVVMKSDPDSPTMDSPKDYITNLSDTPASTPLRVFYNVGLNKDYLRYMSTSAEDRQTKSQAVGVALTDIPAEYLEENTGYYKKQADGYYDEVRQSAAGAERMVAFYSNYFTNNIYDKYPVASDGNKTSRGNSVVSFSPDGDNQFYRFEKNRVLFLIPIPHADNTEDFKRPSEIDLGDLNAEYAEEYRKLITENGFDEITAKEIMKDRDPTTQEGLLYWLNKVRWDTRSAYSAYDCIPVTGGTYEVPAKPGGNGIPGGDPDSDAATRRGDQIDSDNWYYVIREFYYPEEFESGGVKATKVRASYMAIARKGSELGTGLFGGAGDLGGEVEWYNPSKPAGSNTATFTSAEGNGRPASDGVGTWYLSAKPGGVRVGGMANFAGVKGYDIRGGVGEGIFTKDEGVIAGANVTETARTFFLPTVSSTRASGSDDPEPGISAAAEITVFAVNAYLGNNGRILVDDTLLVVTKTVHTVVGGSVEERSSSRVPFTIQVEIQGYVGISKAVVITRDEFNSTLWRRRFEHIDTLTNNQYLLLGDDNTLALADAKGQRLVEVNGQTYYAAKENGEVTRDANGKIQPGAKYDGPVYYIYVGTNLRTGLFNDKTLRVFEADVKYNSKGEIIDKEGDIYGNLSLRGGRTYYLLWNQYKMLDQSVRDKGKSVYGTEPDSMGLGKAFIFHILDITREEAMAEIDAETGGGEAAESGAVPGDGETAGEDGPPENTQNSEDREILLEGYQPGDREFWINKVYLIPRSDVDGKNWSWGSGTAGDHTYTDESGENVAIKKGEAGYYFNSFTSDKKFDINDPSEYLNDGDWRTGYGAEPEDQAIQKDHPGYILLSQFKVAHIRTEDDEGATTATELASNNGFWLQSKFLTTSVPFVKCTNRNHNHGDMEFGVATIELMDGQGRGFDNIINYSAYSVTEILDAAKLAKGFRFLKVEHIEEAGLRTTYPYLTAASEETGGAGGTGDAGNSGGTGGGAASGSGSGSAAANGSGFDRPVGTPGGGETSIGSGPGGPDAADPGSNTVGADPGENSSGVDPGGASTAAPSDKPDPGPEPSVEPGPADTAPGGGTSGGTPNSGAETNVGGDPEPVPNVGVEPGDGDTVSGMIGLIPGAVGSEAESVRGDDDGGDGTASTADVLDPDPRPNVGVETSDGSRVPVEEIVPPPAADDPETEPGSDPGPVATVPGGSSSGSGGSSGGGTSGNRGTSIIVVPSGIMPSIEYLYSGGFVSSGGGYYSSSSGTSGGSSSGGSSSGGGSSGGGSSSGGGYVVGSGSYAASAIAGNDGAGSGETSGGTAAASQTDLTGATLAKIVRGNVTFMGSKAYLGEIVSYTSLSRLNGHGTDGNDIDGRHYYWNDELDAPIHERLEISANFETPNEYNVVGETSMDEEAVHYYNIDSTFTTPGTGGPGLTALLTAGLMLITFGLGLEFLYLKKRRLTLHGAGPGTAGHTGLPGRSPRKGGSAY